MSSLIYSFVCCGLVTDCLICIDNSLILHIYIIVRKHYRTYFELIHAFYIWFWNNAK